MTCAEKIKVIQCVVLLAFEIFLSNAVWASSSNVCADATTEYCQNQTGTELNQCLARKRNYVAVECAELVEVYYSQNLAEIMPPAEEPDPNAEKLERPLSQAGILLGWPNPRVNVKQKSMNSMAGKNPSNVFKFPDVENTIPEGNMYNPYSNLLEQIDTYNQNLSSP